jgi:hypothetical protein
MPLGWPAARSACRAGGLPLGRPAARSACRSVGLPLGRLSSGASALRRSPSPRSHNSCNLPPAAQCGPETRGAPTRRGKSAGVMQGEARCRQWRGPCWRVRVLPWLLAAVPLASLCTGFSLHWLLSALALSAHPLSALPHLPQYITPAICPLQRRAARKLGARRPGMENLQELCTGRRGGVCRSYAGGGAGVSRRWEGPSLRATRLPTRAAPAGQSWAATPLRLGP